MDQKKIKIAAGITFVFFLGFLSGSLGTGIYVKHRIGRFIKGDPSERQTLIMKKLRKKLDLTRSQESDIAEIVNNSLKELHIFRRKHRSEAEAIIDRAAERIKEKLNEEQRYKMDELLRKLKVSGLSEKGMKD